MKRVHLQLEIRLLRGKSGRRESGAHSGEGAVVGKESSGMVRRGPQHWRLWLQEPWDVAKDDAVATERPTCVAVKREGGTDRQTGDG